MEKINPEKIKAYVDKYFVYSLKNVQWGEKRKHLEAMMVGSKGVYEQLQNPARIQYTMGALTEDQLNKLRL